MVGSELVAVVGLGYVGMPLAVGFAEAGYDVVGFDIDPHRIAELRSGNDHTGEVEPETLRSAKICYTCDESDLDGRTMFIVTVPTPIDDHKQPELGPVLGATRTVARHLSSGAVVVYESTVYPGVTEELCRPLLAEISGLTPGVDFTVGYSPERINPGDKEHCLRSIVKVVSGEDAATLDRVATLYGTVVEAGIHRASSIRVAEAAKVIENTQRDLNIALMNELAIIFDRMGISTREVLAAAGTKWNFLRFSPGLVGGHCIGVDPYYLTAKAEQLGYHPEVILAGRRINDNMGRYVAQRLVKALLSRHLNLEHVRVAVLGVTFKENVPDIRNTRVTDILSELKEYGIEAFVCDPIADAKEVLHEYDLELTPIEQLPNVQAIVLAVPHRELICLLPALVDAKLAPNGILFDVRSALDRQTVRQSMNYLAL